MFNCSLDELADNKLLILYILNKINFPISNSQLTDIVLENNLMNYFTFQQYFSELLNSNFLVLIDKEAKQNINITKQGNDILELFMNRISQDKIEKINGYLKDKIITIKKEAAVTADYTIENENSYTVNLKATENDIVLIDIKINVVSNKQARDLCAKWKENSSKLYNKMITLLIDET
ncbi:MAG: DUF4364 family protein [Bacillota bacterium]|nr:DUF4364 family protein [Bacillota bacterium]